MFFILIMDVAYVARFMDTEKYPKNLINLIESRKN